MPIFPWDNDSNNSRGGSLGFPVSTSLQGIQEISELGSNLPMECDKGTALEKIGEAEAWAAKAFYHGQWSRAVQKEAQAKGQIISNNAQTLRTLMQVSGKVSGDQAMLEQSAARMGFTHEANGKRIAAWQDSSGSARNRFF